MRHMIIDIGSNSVKYDIFEINEKNFIRIDHKATVMGFLSYVSDGVLSDTGFDILCTILNNYILESAIKGCDKIHAFATASFRSCKDPISLIKQIYLKTSVEVELFTGKTEGYMSFLGVLHSHPEIDTGVMFDMGGGSTEVNIFKNRQSDFLVSLPFGALSMKNEFANRNYEEFGIDAFATKKELDNIYKKAFETVCSFNIPKVQPCTAIMVGGSAQFIGFLCNSADDDGIVRFTKERLCDVIDQYSFITKEKAEYLVKNIPKRYLLVIPAAISYKAIFDYMGIENMMVSKGGIRDGYMEHILKHQN